MTTCCTAKSYCWIRGNFLDSSRKTNWISISVTRTRFEPGFSGRAGIDLSAAIQYNYEEAYHILKISSSYTVTFVTTAYMYNTPYAHGHTYGVVYCTDLRISGCRWTTREGEPMLVERIKEWVVFKLRTKIRGSVLYFISLSYEMAGTERVRPWQLRGLRGPYICKTYVVYIIMFKRPRLFGDDSD